MEADANIVRLLGATQLLVIVGSVVTDRLLATAVGSGSISDILVNISNNTHRMRISNLTAICQSMTINFMCHAQNFSTLPSATAFFP